MDKELIQKFITLFDEMATGCNDYVKKAADAGSAFTHLEDCVLRLRELIKAQDAK